MPKYDGLGWAIDSPICLTLFPSYLASKSCQFTNLHSLPSSATARRDGCEPYPFSMAWRGHLSKNIKELRFLMCQSSPASSSTRAFVERNYKELKTLNPKLPILIRECSGVEPQLWARYDLGVEKGIKLEGLSEGQIFKALEDLVKAGQSSKA
ncbi:unnamed protein product [Sphenostylis stenocarpa]|uniref:Ribosomal protein/NADH dehydrogenase domain-containing protein n=1 Tax=Sphenostylis stenocarpa TaxID=92480 RepID=A0AA86T713_9FABA|nr:unnamed protein product [Sphenostylis stenocarpa]